MRAAIGKAVGEGRATFIDATDLATRLLGDAIATNMFMLGFGWQKGLVPLSLAAIVRAIELNEIAIEANKRAFAWGRYAAHDLAAVERIAAPAEVVPLGEHLSRNLDELVERRVKYLGAYQDTAYAARYRALVEHVRDVETSKVGGTQLAEAVARYYAKLLAYKDEYEVARLYTDGGFEKKLAGVFEGDIRLTFHLAPPLLAKPDPVTGVPKKMKFGPWMMSAFRTLARLKRLRGTPLDVFGYSEERRTERALIEEYEHAVNVLLDHLSRENHALALEIASLPEHIRGFGHVKAKSVVAAREKRRELLARYREPGAAERAAA
jgi:indolepyruvate ferredoxin oxidoreductase